MTTAPTELKPSAPAVGGVRVKPLVWRQAWPDTEILCGHSGSRVLYRITRGWSVSTFHVKGPDAEYVGGFDTLAAAMAAAQAHHEAAILSAIEPQAVGDAMVERATHLLEWLPSAYHHCKHGTQDWCESYLKNAADVIRAQDARIAALTAALQAAKGGE